MNQLDISREAHVWILAEVGQNHDGSLGQAHAYIDAASRTGADIVKFQTHIASAESTTEDQFRVAFSYEDATRYDYWKRMEFSAEQWAGLKAHAEEKGLLFMSSPFSIAAVELLERVGVPAWKVGSGEIRSFGMLQAMAASGKPLLVSTGMSGMEEIDDTARRLEAAGAEFMFLQCCSRYPSSLNDVGTNVIRQLADRFGRPVGYSDHSGSIWPSLAAVGAGATLVEAHITMSKEMFGPDVSASLSTEEFKQLVEGVRAFTQINANPVDKDAIAEELEPMRRLFGKGAIAARDLAPGEPLDWSMVDFKKPARGLSEVEFERMIGAPLVSAVLRNSSLQMEHLSARP